MKAPCVAFFACIFLAGGVQASSSIPLEVFAKKPSFNQVRISPKGEYLAFTYEEGTQVKLAVMKYSNRKIISSFEFGENRRVNNFQWLNDDRVGMSVETFTGWLDGTNPNRIWAAANADGSDRRQIWDYQRSNINMISTLDDDPEHVLVTKGHWQDEGRVKAHKLNIYTGREKFLNIAPPAAAHSKPGVTAMGADLDGEIRVAYEYDRGKDRINDEDDRAFLHYRNDDGSWRKLDLEPKRAQPEINPLGFSLDQTRFYFTSDHDGDGHNTQGLFEFNTETDALTLVFRHDDVDIGGGMYGMEGQLIGVTYEPGYPQTYFIDDNANAHDRAVRQSLLASFQGQHASITSNTDDGRYCVVWVYSDRNPGEFLIYDNQQRQLKYFASSKPEVKPELMARVEPFTIQARDGLKMYGQLTIPNNVEETNLPMVVYPHGGPYGAADDWRWDRRAQMLASRGYLVMQLNFRGSGGYGAEFRKAGYGEWGAKMQDDLTDATRWAINTGLADGERVCIHGVSYGGYASMNAVVREPDLYKCSIPDAGPYELNLQWNRADSFRGYPDAGRQKKSYVKRSIGGFDNNEERSPVYHLDRLKAGLFIVHGKNDVRVPIENAYLLEKKLKEKDIPYRKMYKKDGHGFQKEDYRVELYEEMLEFLELHIGPGARPGA